MQARALDALGKVKRVNGRLRYATDSAAHIKKERFQRSDTHAHADAPRNVRSHAVIHGSARVFGHHRRLRRLRRPSPVVLSQTTTHRRSSYRKTLFHAITPGYRHRHNTSTAALLLHTRLLLLLLPNTPQKKRTNTPKSHSLCALHALAPSRPRPNPPISSRLCPRIPVPRSLSHLHSKAQYTNKTHTHRHGQVMTRCPRT